MSRLPSIGGDNNQWGTILNDYLSVSHSVDGTLKDTSIAKVKLDTLVQASLSKADTALQSVTKADVGLSNVDNTSDASKPISTATQTALNAKLATTDLDTSTAGLVQNATSSTSTALSTTYALKAAGGGRTATATVYSSAFPYAAPATDTTRFNWVCDGVDDQVEINAAIAAVNAAGGGKVQLLGDAFYTTGAIQMRTSVWLSGEGLGTVVKAASDFGTGMVTLFSSTETHATKLTDMTLHGDGRGVTAGVHYIGSGQAFSTSPSTSPDMAHQITGLYVYSIGNATVAGHGLHFEGSVRAGKYSDIRVLGVTGCGVWVDTADSHYVNIEVGSCGKNGPAVSDVATAPVGHGFYDNGANNMFTACKAWYCRATGFYFHGSRGQYVNCQAQDNYSVGFDLYYGWVSVIGCHADSNGQGVGAGGLGQSGFRMKYGSSSIVGCLSYDRTGQTWQQQYGFEFVGSSFAHGRLIGCVTQGNAAASQLGTPGTGTTVDIQDAVGGASRANVIVLAATDPVPAGTPPGTVIVRTS